MDASLIEQIKLKYVDLIKDPGIGHVSSVASPPAVISLASMCSIYRYRIVAY
jgi:hypothetical protein